jgi:hypothetical protein
MEPHWQFIYQIPVRTGVSGFFDYALRGDIRRAARSDPGVNRYSGIGMVLRGPHDFALFYAFPLWKREQGIVLCTLNYNKGSEILLITQRNTALS